MSTRAADDYPKIAARMAEIAGELPIRDNDARERDVVCARCDGGGWIEMYSPFPPAFQTCPACDNPQGWPSP